MKTKNNKTFDYDEEKLSVLIGYMGTSYEISVELKENLL
jgi:hypothetical protein